MSMRYLAGVISAFYNPLKVPDAPTIGTATAGNAQISITFTAPTNVGGGAITSYIATAKKTSDGTSVSATGTSSPVVITGVTGVPYTVTVVAINSFGPSISSEVSNSVTPFIVGGVYGGGFFVGQISTAGNGIADYNLVVAPTASGQFQGQWKTIVTATAGTSSIINGPANTAAMITAGAAAHPCGQFCDNLVTGGYSDWYMPATNELEVCYYNLKPNIASNNTSFGINANAVPARASNYTAGAPAQTSAAIFQQTTGAESFMPTNYYWASTSISVRAANLQAFYNGTQYTDLDKYRTFHVRAMRRVAV